jgi:hypothetical protein
MRPQVAGKMLCNDVKALREFMPHPLDHRSLPPVEIAIAANIAEVVPVIT